MNYLDYTDRRTRHALSIPFIWLAIIPFAILDIVIYIVQKIVFPLYDLEAIERSGYIKIDRHKLAYLNYVEKINCAYCGYANGLIAYATIVVAELELYWCGIRHEGDRKFEEPDHHNKFLQYNDKQSYVKKREKIK